MYLFKVIYNYLKNVKILIKRFNFLFILLKPFSNIIRIILDKRYFYFYLQGLITNIFLRNYFAKIEANLFKSKRRFSEKADEIRMNSYVENPLAISKNKAKKIYDSLKDLKCLDQANKVLEFDIKSRPSANSLAFYNEIDLFQSMPILEIAVNEKLINLYTDLYGCDPIIDTIAAWWTFPSNQNHDTHYWHRDIDTLNSLKFWVYLTDVDLNSGPHHLIPGSHAKQTKTSKYKVHKDEEFEVMTQEYGSKVFIGPAGCNILENTFAFHKGSNPKEKPRLLLEIIYSCVRTPFSNKKPFILLDNSSKSSLIRDNIALFKGKIIS